MLLEDGSVAATGTRGACRPTGLHAQTFPEGRGLRHAPQPGESSVNVHHARSRPRTRGCGWLQGPPGEAAAGGRAGVARLPEKPSHLSPRGRLRAPLPPRAPSGSRVSTSGLALLPTPQCPCHPPVSENHLCWTKTSYQLASSVSLRGSFPWSSDSGEEGEAFVVRTPWARGLALRGRAAPPTGAESERTVQVPLLCGHIWAQDGRGGWFATAAPLPAASWSLSPPRTLRAQDANAVQPVRRDKTFNPAPDRRPGEASLSTPVLGKGSPHRPALACLRLGHCRPGRGQPGSRGRPAHWSCFSASQVAWVALELPTPSLPWACSRGGPAPCQAVGLGGGCVPARPPGCSVHMASAVPCGPSL